MSYACKRLETKGAGMGTIRRISIVLARSFIPAMAILMLGYAGRADARSETLRWQHPNPGTVSSFKVYVGSVSGGVDVLVQSLGKPTPDGSGVYTATISVADGATVYVTLTALDAAAAESVRSNEILLPGMPGTLGAPGKPTLVP
jgi:hypothetical protein